MRLCADVGGTKVRIAMVDESHQVVELRKYPVSAFSESAGDDSGLPAAIHKFLEEIEFDSGDSGIDYLLVSAAGPVANGRVKFTNSDWALSEDDLHQRFTQLFSENLRVRLLNDFEALAYGLSLIDFDADVRAILPNVGHGDTSIVCGPGTGLGLAALKYPDDDPSRMIAVPSEGGHQVFPIQYEKEKEFADQTFVSRVTYEDVLSGRGLQKLFSYFSKQANISVRDERLPEEIIKDYERGSVPAEEALTLFASVLGSFCGNMVLALGATKGVFLWGGILKSFPQKVLKDHMVPRFQNRGRVSSYIANVPIYKITSDEIALRGCSVAASVSRWP